MGCNVYRSIRRSFFLMGLQGSYGEKPLGEVEEDGTADDAWPTRPPGIQRESSDTRRPAPCTDPWRRSALCALRSVDDVARRKGSGGNVGALGDGGTVRRGRVCDRTYYHTPHPPRRLDHQQTGAGKPAASRTRQPLVSGRCFRPSSSSREVGCATGPARVVGRRDVPARTDAAPAGLEGGRVRGRQQRRTRCRVRGLSETEVRLLCVDVLALLRARPTRGGCEQRASADDSFLKPSGGRAS